MLKCPSFVVFLAKLCLPHCVVRQFESYSARSRAGACVGRIEDGFQFSINCRCSRLETHDIPVGAPEPCKC